VSKEKEKILGIRPFNMANFSGGYGYMPVYAIFGVIVSFPAAFVLWTGFAISFKNEDGALDYQILKRRLNRIVLPLCLILFIPWTIFLATTLYGSIWAYALATVWAAAIPGIGIYCSMLFSAKLLAAKEKLTKGSWLVLTLIFLAAIALLGLYIMFLLTDLGDTLDSLSR